MLLELKIMGSKVHGRYWALSCETHRYTHSVSVIMTSHQRMDLAFYIYKVSILMVIVKDMSV